MAARPSSPTEDNIDTWRQWVYEWDADPGSHTIEVRATDSPASTQTSERVAASTRRGHWLAHACQ